MTKPATITQWLQQPASFSAEDRKMMAAMLKTYPYFLPARYMEAADLHYDQPFNDQMLDRMRLYAGNWLLFHEFLEKATAANGKREKAASLSAAEDISFEEEELQDDTINDYNEEDFDDDFESLNNVDFDEEEELYEEELPETTAIQEPVIEEPILVKTPEKPQLAPTESIREQTKTKPAEQSQVTAEKEAQSQPEDIPPAPVEKTEIQEQVTVAEIPPPVPAETEDQRKTTPPAPIEEKEEQPVMPPPVKTKKEETLIQPIYTEDYFLYQGIQVPEQVNTEKKQPKDKSLMVVMSFSEWLLHFKTKGEREKEELEDQKALKTMWQKEKLAAALEEENEEIPETVFEMAVNSITKEDDLASESLAEIMVKQGKYDKAIEMYRKLSLRNPQKNAYFARKIEELNKEKLS